MTLLNDPEWREWSNREIADKCAVTHTMVNKLRDETSGNGFQIDRKVSRGGTVYTMNTARIGVSHPSLAEVAVLLP